MAHLHARAAKHLRGALRKVATKHHLSVEDLLVHFFIGGTRTKSLLERVHARVCANMRTVHHQQQSMAELRAMHSPIKLLKLILDMGAPRSGYRSLVTFCSALLTDTKNWLAGPT